MHTAQGECESFLWGIVVDSGFKSYKERVHRHPEQPEVTETPTHRLDYTEAQDRPDQRKGQQPTTRNRPQSPSTVDSRSASSERSSHQTQATSLPALQQKGLDEHDQLEPLAEEDLDPGSFDLVAPLQPGIKQYSLETRSEQLFSREHLQLIFNDPSLLLRFTAFLSSNRARSIPILIYYLDAIKALKAISYANAIAEALEPIAGFDFTGNTAKATINADLEEKSRKAFDAMVREDLPAFVTHTYIQTVSLSIQRKITGTLPSHLREASEGLAEVFCLTDPSRPDNPIVFASEGNRIATGLLVMANSLQSFTGQRSMVCHTLLVVTVDSFRGQRRILPASEDSEKRLTLALSIARFSSISKWSTNPSSW